MADENNQDPANPTGNEAPEGQENDGSNDEGQGDQGEGSDGKSTEKSAEEIKAEADKKAQEDAAEPPTRKSKLQYIQERQQRREEKRKNLENKPKDPAPVENDGGEDEESLSPEEQKMYQKLEGTFMKKHADKFEKIDASIQQSEIDAVDKEVSDFLKNDEYGDVLKPFEAKIRKYAIHPSRVQVPIEELVYGIIGRDAFALGAKQAREAQKKAAASKNGGASARKPEGGTGKDYANMSEEEFKEEQRKVLQGR